MLLARPGGRALHELGNAANSWHMKIKVVVQCFSSLSCRTQDQVSCSRIRLLPVHKFTLAVIHWDEGQSNTALLPVIWTFIQFLSVSRHLLTICWTSARLQWNNSWFSKQVTKYLQLLNGSTRHQSSFFVHSVWLNSIKNWAQVNSLGSVLGRKKWNTCELWYPFPKPSGSASCLLAANPGQGSWIRSVGSASS